MISICIPTYKRPQQLQTLLRTLLTDIEHPEPIEIVICDNDAERSAETVVKAISHTADVPVRYYCEPEQNISLARNKTVAEAQGEWVAFIDDDEVPTHGWLTALHKTAGRFSADGVMGPVVPRLPQDATPWAVDSKTDKRNTSETSDGKILTLNEVATGNALIRTNVLRKLAGPFDPAFGGRGGEDTLAFGRLIHKNGAVFRSCPDAIVFEDVPEVRRSTGWILKRCFRGGQAWADIQGILFGKARLLYSIIRASILISGMLLISPVFIITPGRVRIKFIKHFAALVGQFSVVFSYRFYEYKR